MNRIILKIGGFLFSFQSKKSLKGLTENKSSAIAKWLCFILLISVSFVNAATRTSTATGGNWSANSTWSGGVIPLAGDDVVIANGVTVTVTLSATCKSLTFAGLLTTAGNLVINSGIILTVTNAVTLSSCDTLLVLVSTFDTACTISGAGTLNCASVTVGTSYPLGALGNNVTKMTSTLANFNVTQNFIISSHIGTLATSYVNSLFNLVSGTVNIDGQIITQNQNGVNVSTLSMATGAQSGTLLVSNAAPFNLTGTGTSTITINGTTATVNYDGVAQTVLPTNYTNLIFSNSGIKTTTAGVVVNTLLSMEGTATASVLPTYGAAATLRYNTATARNAGVEWSPTFNSTGGVVIANTGVITMNNAKILGLNAPVNINAGATLATNNQALTFGGNFTNSGTFTAGSSNITIANSGTQSIAGFTTTGSALLSKSSGIATLMGNVNGGIFAINGGSSTAGTLNLGIGLTHTFTGDWNWPGDNVVNGGSSLLRIGGNIADFGSTGNFVSGTGTVEFNGSNQTLVATKTFTYYNLIFSGSGTKDFKASTTINNNFSIATGAIADLTVGLTHSVNTLTLGGQGTVAGSWGSTSSSATNKNDVFFAANSGIVNIAVTTCAIPPSPLATRMQPTCLVTTGSVSLTGLPASGTWTLYRNPGSVIIPHTGTTATDSGLAPGTYTYTVVVASGNCAVSTTNVVINAQPLIATYNGGWTNGPPVPEQAIVFESDYTSAADLSGCSCKVNSTAKVTIKTEKTLTITNSVTVAPTASLIFEDNASLYQVDNSAVNNGEITYERISEQMKDQDYTYWSSPVASQKFSSLSLGTDYYYAFDIATNSWIWTPDTMETGRGYIIKARDASPFPYDQKLYFKGIPNNGLLSLSTLTKLDEYVLVGNPYPSALFADDFLRGNSSILEGTLYFWTHITPLSFDGTKWDYASNDYATYNFTGGVTPGQGTASGSESAPPSGYIAAGQSFFVNAKIGGGQVVFNNGMRVTGQNTQFFKSSKTNKITAIEKNRVWLNLTNKGGAFKQILVGYIEGATNDYESMFDGISLNGNVFVNFYSIIKDKKLSIQGRAIPFDETDLVYLGYSSEIAGDFTIGINATDGLLSSHAIYLEDKVTGIIHDLRQSDYTFNTGKTEGVDDRFVLRYTNKTLGTGEFEIAENSILVAVANKEIQINAFDQTIDAVFVYDVSGKLIYKKDKVENSKWRINPEASGLKLSNQVLIVKVVLDNKHTETRKVIY